MAGGDTAAEMLTFRAELGELGEPERLIGDAWDLAGVADAYDEVITGFGRLRPKTPEAVFRAQTLLVHAWRKFPFLDPDLPEATLPSRWPRQRAHEVFQERHAAWHGAAQDYFRSLEAVNRAAA
jgi:phenylacetic acid degradation operon negative regulatory protein